MNGTEPYEGITGNLTLGRAPENMNEVVVSLTTAQTLMNDNEDIKKIRKPVIGFYGGIDNHTFDIRFAEEVVSRMPEYSFVFVGKASVDCSGLLKMPNVTMVGQKQYEEIPHYGKYFDVAIMPWNRNRWIEVCNPIKLKEYLALGKPIVSTPFSELDKYNGCVYRAGEPGEFAAMIKKALEEDCIELKNKRRKLVERSTWQSKADLVLQNLQ
jgi:glycosyltransferase involved in cell wall biosynthesis